MNVPRRILEGGLGDWERRIVQSAVSDAPSPQFRRRMTTELGVLVSAASLTGATQALGQTLGVLAWIKLLGVGALVGAATVGVSYAVSGPPASERSGVSLVTNSNNPSAGSERESTAVRPAPLATAPSSRGSVEKGAPSKPGPDVAPSAPAHAAPGTSKARAEKGVSPGATALPPASAFALDSALSAELRAIERVRAALAGGDARAALGELDRYEASPSANLFRVEAQVLRIEALVRSGDLALARDLARGFLAEHEASPYERRVRTLIGENP